MVAADENDSAVQPIKIDFWVEPETKVAKEDDKIFLVYFKVPVLDECFVHVFYGIKWAATIADYV